MRHWIRSNTSNDSRPPPKRTPSGDESRLGKATERPERAVLVSVLLPATRADLNEPLGELASLAASAGVEVVDAMIQKRMSLSAAWGLGKGKLAELVERVEQADADVVIFDNDLSPRQIRGVEREVGRKVIDRSELILDIFASRAKTREAQLQVELAQLEYTAPRLRGLWTHLERIAGAGGATAAGAVGGVGTRGPGERQIEIDRRIVKKRIDRLKQEIREIDRRKTREVQSRRDRFTICLVGYTNSGKSTLHNRLTGADQFVADLLFATLDTKTTRWELGEGRATLLSDTVGFIRDLPHHLVASFRATLEEAIHADLLLHVVDVSSPTAWQEVEAVEEVLGALGCGDAEQLMLLNKIDVVDDGSLVEMLSKCRANSLRISARRGDGLEALKAEVVRRVMGDTAEATIRVPHREGKLMAEIDRLACVRERRYLTDAVELDISMSRNQLRQLRGRHPALDLVGDDVDSDAPDSPTTPD